MLYLARIMLIFLMLTALQQKVFSQSIVYADSVKVDSIKNVLKHLAKTNEIFKPYLYKLDTLSNDEFIIKEIIANWLISNCEKTGNEDIKIKAQQLLGRAYFYSANYTLANEYFNKVLATGKEDDYVEIKSKALEGQAQVFYQTEQFDKQKEYILRNLDFSRKNKYMAGIATAKEDYTSILESNDNQTGKDTFNLIIKTWNESLLLWLELKDTAKIIHAYTDLGQTYGDYGHFDTGINIVLKAKEYFTNRNKEATIFYYFILGKIYFNKARANNKNPVDFKNAIKYFEACIPLAQEFNNKKQEAWCYDWLSASYKFLGNYTQAYKYLEKHSYLYGSIVSESNFKQLAAVEHKYEKEKQAKEIIQLNVVNKQKYTLNKILIAAAATLIFIGFLGYRNFRHKQKLQHLKIVELEKEKISTQQIQQYQSKLEIEQISNFFSASLITKASKEAVLWDVAKNLIGKLGFEDCMIYLWNTNKTKMIQYAGYGPKGSIEEIKTHVFDALPGQGVVGYVMQTKENVLINDTTKDARYRVDDMERLSEIAVPIIFENELIGILDSEHSQKNFYTAQHLAMLENIAVLTAIKIKSIEFEEGLLHTKEQLLKAQLKLTESLLQGQEEERSRLAKDLHDGLGGMLSGIKLSFNNMKENLVLTPENFTAFQQSITRLDETIIELRKVSHNLMPDVLLKFGLAEALQDYCSQLNSATSTTSVVFQHIGENRTISNTAKLYVYRIIQELINNSIKHGNASSILAQLTTNADKILVSVDDDGKGFNPADLINSKGIGMGNIKQRVEYLKGKMDIDSQLGKGTSVNIELNV